MWSRIGILVWQGLWTGFGVELSFFVLWVGWHFIHSKWVKPLDPSHWAHKLHDYFSSN